MMITDKKWEKILEETGFEFTLDELKKCLSEPIAMDLYRWLEKYHLNIRKVMKLRLTYSDQFIAPCQLDKNDPDYDEFNSWPKFAKPDAPEEVKFASEVCNAYKPIEDCLPHIEFSMESIFNEEI